MKTNTVMEGSNLGYQTWALAIYLIVTNLKGVASLKLHRELGITQKSAWHLNHRLREVLKMSHPKFGGPIEVDETYVGGATKGKGRGPHHDNKAVVVGLKDQATNKVVAKPIESAGKRSLHSFVIEHTQPGAKLYTDEWQGYEGIPFDRTTFKH